MASKYKVGDILIVKDYFSVDEGSILNGVCRVDKVIIDDGYYYKLTPLCGNFDVIGISVIYFDSLSNVTRIDSNNVNIDVLRVLYGI